MSDRSSTVITLMTDFGQQDTYVGQMKGVIHGIHSNAVIVDLTHAIPAQDILNAALQIDAAIDAFAPATVHVIVVDPGVGTSRSIVAVQADGHRFVCPNNGILSRILSTRRIEKVVRITNGRYLRSGTSDVFHGRDIMAPAAAHLAAGIDITALGEPLSVESLVRISLPAVERISRDDGHTRVIGCVTRLDRFGNAITSIHRTDVGLHGTVRVAKRSAEIPIVTHYAERSTADFVALFGSSNWLEIAVPNGSAAAKFGLKPGDAVEWQSQEL